MRILLVPSAAILLVACNRNQPTPEAPAGGAGKGDAGEAAAEEPPAELAAAPLGSQENPVRCDMPSGERAYLDRLRCPDGSRPRYERLGSYGAGPHGNVLDGYRVLCGERETTIYMDMYHPGYVETAPVEGFTIVN